MIDFEKRTITGKSGTIYRIAPESIPVARWNEYLLQGSNLAFNTDFADLYESMGLMLDKLTAGNDILNAIDTSIKTLRRLRGGLRGFTNNEPPKIIKFAALFCMSEHEDVSIYDAALIKRKFEDWKHIPMTDFFLLSKEVIPLLKEALNQSYQEVK